MWKKQGMLEKREKQGMFEKLVGNRKCQEKIGKIGRKTQVKICEEK